MILNIAAITGKQPDAVPAAELGAFGMALQDNQLVPEEGVLGDKLGLAAAMSVDNPLEHSDQNG